MKETGAVGKWAGAGKPRYLPYPSGAPPCVKSGSRLPQMKRFEVKPKGQTIREDGAESYGSLSREVMPIEQEGPKDHFIGLRCAVVRGVIMKS